MVQVGGISLLFSSFFFLLSSFFSIMNTKRIESVNKTWSRLGIMWEYETFKKSRLSTKGARAAV